MTVQLHINEVPVTVAKGTTLLQAARQHDIYIPTLCDFPGLPPHGSCRMCIVEIQGKSTTPTACTTLAEEGMIVQTNSPKVQALRAELLQMLLADHPSSCLFCPEKENCDDCMVTLKKAAVTTGCRSCNKDSQCEIQKLVQEFGLAQADYPVRYRGLSVQRNDPFIDRDSNLCILCSRCIRVCDENHFAASIAYTKRGSESLVSAAFGDTLLAAGCSFCGDCVEVCPTGSLSEKTRKWDGLPENETLTTCPFCEMACQIRLLSKNGSVIGSLPARQAGSEILCVQGRFGIPELVNSPTRLTAPLKRAGTEALAVRWDELIHLAAQKIAGCAPEAFDLVISASCSDEDRFAAQKFKTAVKQHAFPGPSSLEPNAWDLLLRRSQPLEDFSGASAIICLGLDGELAQSVITSRIQRARKTGARLLWVNSQESRSALFADIWLRPEEGDGINLLARLTRALQAPQEGRAALPDENEVVRAVHMLKTASKPILLVAPSFIENGSAENAAGVIAALAGQLDARLSWVSDGTSPRHSGQAPRPDPHLTRVLYLIGENIPVSSGERPFILYQNIALPDSAASADLLLPMAAFSETEGSRRNDYGAVHAFHSAVPAPGQALPGWQIIARIAREMGLAGFDYDSLEALRSEMALQTAPLTGNPPASRIDYMGFPLTRWVEGLRWVVSDEGLS